MNTQEPLTYSDVQELAEMSSLKVIKDRLGAVRFYF
jgi:hypothetical protein